MSCVFCRLDLSLIWEYCISINHALPSSKTRPGVYNLEFANLHFYSLSCATASRDGRIICLKGTTEICPVECFFNLIGKNKLLKNPKTTAQYTMNNCLTSDIHSLSP